ncbi:MAG: hypothetical protein BM556_17970 [Bacteriovorax sp. MedPE-SWde]|nr:MAG: hypothetical protein BM556_17970 [Bacteriovorax sp. MedPE-SWde]
MYKKIGYFHHLDQDGTLLSFNEIELKLPKDNKKSIEIVKEVKKENLIKKYFNHLNSGITPLVLNPEIPDSKTDSLLNVLEKDSNSYSSLSHITCSSGTTSHNGPIKTFSFPIQRPLSNSRAHYASLQVNEPIKVLFPMPLTHSFGVVIGMLGTVEMGHSLYTFQETPRNDVLLNVIDDQEIDLLYLTPTLTRLLLKHLKRKKISNSKKIKISIGAAHIYKSEILELMKHFPNAQIFYTYGLSEVGPRVSTLDCGTLDKNQMSNIEEEVLPIGRPLNGVELQIKDKLLHVKSIYTNTNIDQEVFFNTMDEASSDSKNTFLRGRTDNTINFAGVNIYPQEMEPIINRILELSSVLIAMPSKLYGEIPVLVIEATKENENDFSTKDFIDKLSLEVSTKIHPQRIVFLRNFPRTSMGKIKRKNIQSLIS